MTHSAPRAVRFRSLMRASRGTLFPAACVALLGATTPGMTDTWTGARLRRIEPPVRPEAARQIQVPILSYDPVQPQVDRDGRVWLGEKNGTVRVLLPYGGELARWRLEAGLEAATLPDRDGARLALDRDGRLMRLDPARPMTFETLTSGLPGGVGPGCRLGTNYFWTDALGGVVVTDRHGKVLQRVADVLFARKRYRGGAVALCGDAEALVGVAGGKIARFDRNGLRSADTPAVLEGASFAPHAVWNARGDGSIVLCTFTKGCVRVLRDGGIVALSESGSFDGPAGVNSRRFVIAHNDGRLALYDGDGARLRDVVLGKGPYWLLRGPDRQMAAQSGGALWLVDHPGNLLRVSGLLQVDSHEARVDRVLSVPSGFGGGGLVLADGTGLLRTNYGATYVLELR